MSISDKITSITNHLTEDYKGITNLGVDLTNVNKNIENIKSCLDDIYDNYPKTSFGEGSNITLTNCNKGKLDFENDIVGYGDTEQESTQGYNLLNLANFTTETTINNVKFTPVANSGIKIYGTASANASLEFAFSITLSGNYTMATRLNGTFTNNESPQVILRSGSSNILYNSSMQQNATKINTFNNVSATVDKVRIVAVNGSSYDCIIYPMLLSGIYTSETLPTFEPYTNGASPNPSYPQEVKYVRGKNRADLIFGKVPSVVNGQLVDSNSGGYTDFIETYGNDFTVSHSVSTNKPYVFFYGSNYSYLGVVQGVDSGYKISTSTYFANTKYIRIRTDDYTNTKNNLQVEEGTIATSYLPYNTLEVISRGKNEFDISQVEIGKAWNNASNTARAVCYMECKPNTTYTISASGLSVFDGGICYVFKKESKEVTTNLGNYEVSTTRTITTDSNCNYLCVQFNKSSISLSDLENVKIQIEEGSTASSYEPYVTPITKQLSLGNYKPSKIGNYRDYFWTDRDTKKWYYHEKIKDRIITGNSGTISKPSTNRFNIDDAFSDYLKSINNITYLSNQYIGYEQRSINAEFDTLVSNVNYGFDLTSGTSYTIRIKDTRYDNIDDFKNALNSNNLHLFYILSSATDTEITDTTLKSQLEEIYNIMSINGTTIIESEGDLPLVLKVRALKGE